MKEHTWYTVIKNTDENILNMSYGFNFKYEHVLALFIDLGYVLQRNEQYIFEGKNVDYIKTEFGEGFDLHLTSCRVGSKKRVWYICKNKPEFNSVRKQQQHTIRYKIAPLQLPFPSRSISTLRNILRKYVISLNSRYISYNAFITNHNVHSNSIVTSETPPPTTPTPAEQVDSFIDESMLLEFSTPVRRSRDKKTI